MLSIGPLANNNSDTSGGTFAQLSTEKADFCFAILAKVRGYLCGAFRATMRAVKRWHNYRRSPVKACGKSEKNSVFGGRPRRFDGELFMGISVRLSTIKRCIGSNGKWGRAAVVCTEGELLLFCCLSVCKHSNNKTFTVVKSTLATSLANKQNYAKAF